MKNVITQLILISILSISCSTNKKKAQKLEQAEIFYNEGTQLLYEKKYTLALNNLLKAYDKKPDDDKINNNLGMTYFFKKNSKKAIKHLKKAIKLNSDNLDALNNLGYVYLSTNKLKNAKKIFLKISKSLTYRTQYRTYYNLGVIEIKRNNYEQAEAYLDQSLKEQENYCPSLYWKAKIQVRLRNYKEAAERFELASKGICYNNPEILYYRAMNDVKLGKIGDARILFNQIIDRFPQTVAAKRSNLQLTAIKNKYDNDKDYISSQYLKEKYQKKTYQPIE